MSGFVAMAAERDGLYARFALACRTVLRRDHQPGPPEVPLWVMPFDHESSDEEIAAVMAGQAGSEIVWINSISGRRQHAVVVQFRGVGRRPGTDHHIEIRDQDWGYVTHKVVNDDYLELLTDEGFHSIYIRQIVSIG